MLEREGYVPIRDLRAGVHFVWSKNEKTGEMGWKLVVKQHTNLYDEMVYVTMRDTVAGVEQTITSNRIHPYFAQVPLEENSLILSVTRINGRPRPSDGHNYLGPIDNGYWVNAANLKPGHRLLNSDESWAEVVSVRIEAKQLTAFNLTVKDFHSYFVKAQANNNALAVWVHNDCFDLDKLIDVLGVDQRTFHRTAKPENLTDFGSELRKTGVRNPDVGMNDAGNIVIRDPRTRNSILSTDVPLTSHRLD